ncbi:pro-resilin [Stomoxys calcitrans]|uniref:pro-resilin n=1 Tax=Stomoxys calcitrans TaxID=35570 RepID=UPI0027E2C83B|nr:pro-resilin [Stomoxys calcitrans]
MKCFATIAFLVCLSVVSGEPPVPQNNYLPPNQQQSPSSNYLPPQNTYQAPNSNYLPPQRGGSGGAAAAPQNSYGAPAVTGAIFPKQGGGGYAGGAGAAGGYGAGAQGSGYGGEENYGPAKYEFKYDVQDYESGNDFGHMESRDGDFTTGRYYVLLPDGRKQIVEYEADQNGYRPSIRYEQVNNGQQAGGRGGNYNNGGYDSNAQQGKFGGYQ